MGFVFFSFQSQHTLIHIWTDFKCDFYSFHFFSICLMFALFLNKLCLNNVKIKIQYSGKKRNLFSFWMEKNVSVCVFQMRIYRYSLEMVCITVELLLIVQQLICWWEKSIQYEYLVECMFVCFFRLKFLSAQCIRASSLNYLCWPRLVF